MTKLFGKKVYFCTQIKRKPPSRYHNMNSEKVDTLHIVARFIDKNKLFPSPAEMNDEGRRIIVGLSGGSDSVALLHILHSLGYPVYVTHCNFHLRGQESDRDEQFACDYATRLGLECHVIGFDTATYMQEHHITSVEMACRQLRYDWWHQLIADDPSLICIAVGHHQDDAIETALINLMRGTGIRGMASMQPFNQSMNVARPLLSLSHAALLDYCSSRQLDFVTDSSNLECDCLRNGIRLQLLPLMERLMPQARKGIATTIGNLLDVDDFVSSEVESSIREAESTFQFDNLIWHVLQPELLPSDTDFVVRAWKRRMELQGYHVSQNRYGLMTDSLEPLPATPTEQCFTTIKGTFSEIADKVDTELDESLGDRLHRRASIMVDESHIKQPLTFRHWQTGDRMKPHGLNGHSKLVSDLFTDMHLPNHLKKAIWLVTDADGQIIWIPFIASAFATHDVLPDGDTSSHTPLYSIHFTGHQNYF